MGIYFADQYSLLHFATGVIAYFWNINLLTWIIIHIVFEILENTEWGMHIINNFPIWPGGKDYADSPINILGDNIFAILGWLVAYCLDYLGKKYLYHF